MNSYEHYLTQRAMRKLAEEKAQRRANRGAIRSAIHSVTKRRNSNNNLRKLQEKKASLREENENRNRNLYSQIGLNIDPKNSRKSFLKHKKERNSNEQEELNAYLEENRRIEEERIRAYTENMRRKQEIAIHRSTRMRQLENNNGTVKANLNRNEQLEYYRLKAEEHINHLKKVKSLLLMSIQYQNSNSFKKTLRNLDEAIVKEERIIKRVSKGNDPYTEEELQANEDLQTLIAEIKQESALHGASAGASAGAGGSTYGGLKKTKSRKSIKKRTTKKSTKKKSTTIKK